MDIIFSVYICHLTSCSKGFCVSLVDWNQKLVVLNVKLGNLFSENLAYGFRSAIYLYFAGGRLE